MKKRVLVLGGTGAMGIYLVPYLAEMGYDVTVVSLDDCEDKPGIRYLKGNAKDFDFLEELLAEHFDAIVDYMIYGTEEFRGYWERFLKNTDHYIFLSSYRVYADEDPVITEQSPRLLDVSKNTVYLESDDYSLFKAREEDIIRASAYSNWTIVRPSITYSTRRFQLVTLEANTLFRRAFAGKPVILPQAAVDVQGTMSWAGDVSRLMAKLVLNDGARQEAFTLSTSEHHTWGEIAKYYEEIMGLKVEWIDTDAYLDILGTSAPYSGLRYQLEYDRLFNRVVDNSKVLRVTGMKQEEFTTLKQGLSLEFDKLLEELTWGSGDIAKRMEAFCRQK